jgi:hypothetical protein
MIVKQIRQACKSVRQDVTILNEMANKLDIETKPYCIELEHVLAIDEWDHDTYDPTVIEQLDSEEGVYDSIVDYLRRGGYYDCWL